MKYEIMHGSEVIGDVECTADGCRVDHEDIDNWLHSLVLRYHNATEQYDRIGCCHDQDVGRALDWAIEEGGHKDFTVKAIRLDSAPHKKRRKYSATDEDAMRRHLEEDPTDPDRRLVFADYLQENGLSPREESDHRLVAQILNRDSDGDEIHWHSVHPMDTVHGLTDGERYLLTQSNRINVPGLPTPSGKYTNVGTQRRGKTMSDGDIGSETILTFPDNTGVHYTVDTAEPIPDLAMHAASIRDELAISDPDEQMGHLDHQRQFVADHLPG